MQLLSMQCSPLGDQSQRATRQRPGYELAVEPDRGGLTRVAGMEMRPSVHPSFQYIQIVIP
jgi:hypothetical protein